MNQTQAAVLAVLLGVLVLLPFSVVVFRLAVRVVAGYAPGVWNTLIAMYLSGVLVIALERAVHAIGIIPSKGIYSFFILLPVLGLVRIVVLSQMINDGNGNSLGFIPALFSYILAAIVTWIGVAVLFAVAAGLFGLKPAQAVVRQYIAQIQKAYGSNNSSGISPGGHPATNGSPAPEAAPLAQETPALVHHYFLRTPIVVPVQYGTMTIPANTEVRLVDESGDSCRVQAGGVTYTVSKAQLMTVP